MVGKECRNMIRFKNLLVKMSKVVPAFAFMLASTTVSQACVLWFHQPKVPEKLKK